MPPQRHQAALPRAAGGCRERTYAVAAELVLWSPPLYCCCCCCCCLMRPCPSVLLPLPPLPPRSNIVQGSKEQKAALDLLLAPENAGKARPHLVAACAFALG